jgi:hypothetical protein
VRPAVAARWWWAALLLMPVVVAGCGTKSKDEPKDLGEQMRDVEADTQVMRDAQASVNEVIRAAGDCETAKPAIAAAMMKLDEVERHVRTAAANQTLGTLRKQVRQAQDMCP